MLRVIEPLRYALCGADVRLPVEHMGSGWHDRRVCQQPKWLLPFLEPARDHLLR